MWKIKKFFSNARSKTVFFCTCLWQVPWKKGTFQHDSFLYIARLFAIVVTERMSFVRELFWVVLSEKSPHFSHAFLARRSDSLRCISWVSWFNDLGSFGVAKFHLCPDAKVGRCSVRCQWLIEEHETCWLL